jgi:hypothetical protein
MLCLNNRTAWLRLASVSIQGARHSWRIGRASCLYPLSCQIFGGKYDYLNYLHCLLLVFFVGAGLSHNEGWFDDNLRVSQLFLSQNIQ